EDDPARAEDPEGGEGPGGDTRVVAEGRGEGRGAQHGPVRVRPPGAAPRQRGRRMATVLRPGLHMIRDEDRVETGLLSEDAELDEFLGPELLCRCLVSQLQRHVSSWTTGSDVAPRPDDPFALYV